jgi:hypothetical protein
MTSVLNFIKMYNVTGTQSKIVITEFLKSEIPTWWMTKFTRQDAEDAIPMTFCIHDDISQKAIIFILMKSDMKT